MPASGRKTGKLNRADDIYTRLKAELFDFRLLPGDRFSENEIAARMSASRTPVREALFRLQREGYVAVLPRAGWQVRALDFALFDQLYEVRIILEEAALARLGRGDADRALGTLETVWQCPPEARKSDPVAVWKLDEAFHAALVEAAGNEELSRMHRDVTERLRIVRRLDFTKPKRIDATYEEHAAILRRVRSGRVAEAQRLLRTHIETSRAEVHKITLSTLHQARLGQNRASRV